jgi:hydroxypyruvate reductase
MPPRTLAAAEAAFDLEVRSSNAPMTASELRSAFALYDAMMVTLGDRVTAEMLGEFGRPRCRMLANFGVGYNHIDVAACRAHGITVSNTPGAVTDATADIAMTLMLMTARRAGEGERLVRKGDWTGWHPTQLLGMHLTGKKVGIVGMGRIGQAIARRCHFGFGMEVAYHSRSPKDLEFPATQMGLAELAGAVDVLVAAVPGSAETHHLINRDVLNAMQKHAIFVNISRGDVVDEAALATALTRGVIAGAGLDVYEQEPQVTPALLGMEQAVLLPHLGTASLEVREMMGLMVIENLRAYVEGREVPNAVN